VHEGSSVLVPTLGDDRPFNPLLLHAVSHSFEAMLACAQMIAFGVLERHPGLRLLFLESSGGWAPFWLERLDDQAESFGGFCPHMVLRPSEYFARQCAISFDVDEHTLPVLAPFLGGDRIVWGSDYPHHDATFPGAVDAIRSTVATCSTAAQVHVLGLNARRFYRLPSRRTGLPGLLDDYFTAVTAQEIDLVRALFAPDAVFESGDVRLQGVDAICGYYTAKTFTFDDFRPVPGLPVFDGTQIEVDIDVHLGGARRSVHDVFETDGTRITALRVSGFEEVLRSAGR
ncbi:MAG TPA: amidohydrolase family protein, partial [Acidimicrobiales bacterium]|nr:amidohydrolase family protein [Acidimicrobiales bacterium]